MAVNEGKVTRFVPVDLSSSLSVVSECLFTSWCWKAIYYMEMDFSALQLIVSRSGFFGFVCLHRLLFFLFNFF